MNIQEARSFKNRFISGEFNSGEYDAFVGWLRNASIDEIGDLADEYEAANDQWALSQEGPSAEWIAELERRLDKIDEQERRAAVKKMPHRWMSWVAAAVVLVVSAGSYLWYSHSSVFQPISEGSKSEVLSRILSVPVGQQDQVVLPDGSKVWLNSGSVLKYPAAFNGHQRIVELSGEAYFEVAANASQPFQVKVGDMAVEVLGTHFNVKAYAGDGVIRTSLLEGSIKVVRGSLLTLLQPNQQIVLPYTGSGNDVLPVMRSGIKAESVLAWKQGYMNFEHDDLRSIMGEISRCFNVEIKYSGTFPQRYFHGKFLRKGNLDDILKVLDKQGFHFTRKGSVIEVTP